MIRHALRHSEELHNIIVETMIEEKRTIESPQNSYVEEIKYDLIVKTFKELKKRWTIE